MASTGCFELPTWPERLTTPAMAPAPPCAAGFGYEAPGLMTPHSPVPGQGARPSGLPGHVMAALPTPVLPDPEVDRLQQVLEDVRFLLERGYWQAALAATRAALTRDET
jgi:hypothetical protein